MNPSLLKRTALAALGAGVLANATAQTPVGTADLQQIKTVFVIAMENHNFVQPTPYTTSPQQILGNPAAPYLNSLITPGNPNAAQVSYAVKYYNSGVGVHPSEPNYVWQEAASDFNFDADTDPSVATGNIYTVPHFAGQLNAAGIPWKNYQENLSLTTGPQHSSSGTSATVINPYYGTGQFNYAPKHNPMAFFSDTYNQNVYELTNLFVDLTNNTVGRYNWITPNQYNDAHSALTGGFTYKGISYTGDQAAIAQGDNFLAAVIPQILASAAYTNNGAIIIWWDETEGGDTTNYTLPEIIISPLAKGNAYASSLEYNHSSDLKTVEEIYGLNYISNSIPAAHTNAKGAGYNYVSAVNDLSDLFQTAPVPAANNSAALQPIKTVFQIAMENHNFVQPNPYTSSPEQILGNPAAPYLNSLITPGNSNAVHVSYATKYYNSGTGVHPSEPNYVWEEAASDFNFDADTDPSVVTGNIYTMPHFTGQLNAAGISWRNYQENLQLTTGPQHSSSGTSATVINPYYGTGQYNYAPKHNPMAFFSDTYNQNVYELANLFTDLANNAVGRYNWITPNQYNDAHSALTGGFTYNGVTYTGDQAAIAQGDNFLATVIPQILASAAYTNNGAIIIWWDETEGGDTTNYTLPEIIISPLAKGNAYASSLEYNHSSDLRTLEEIYGLGFVSNSIPAAHTNAKGTGYNYVANVNDLSDLFKGVSMNGRLQLAGGAVRLSLGGSAGQSYTVLASDQLSTPLSQWSVVGGGMFSGGTEVFTDTDAPKHLGRYYRIKIN